MENKENIFQESSFTFNKLTPRDDVDFSIYDEALKYAFDSNNSDVRNIAICGPYSSGKSSILLSYEKKNGKKYLHVSLSNFRSEKMVESIDEVEGNAIENNNSRVVERRILNQIIHQINPENIKKSKFRTKKIDNNCDRFIWTFDTIITFVGVILVLFRNTINDWIQNAYWTPIKDVVEFFNNPYFKLVIWGFCLVIGIKYLCKIVLGDILLPSINKVSFGGSSIELFNKKDSVFDQYLDEVLYLIQKSDYEVIVFEDIDRFEDIELFTRLREINWLVNEKQPRLDKGQIKFIYLIKDGILASEDRTKFFDFIIPIIPIMDCSNSYNIILKYVNSIKASVSWNYDVLKGVSKFINEKRLLDNIFNEFNIYKFGLRNSNIDVNCLFGMIVYKNTFPEDYNDLHAGKGFVYDFFECKKEIVERIAGSINNRIEEINIIINEPAEDLVELGYIKKEHDSNYTSSLARIPAGQAREDYIKQEERWQENFILRKEALEHNRDLYLKEKQDTVSSLKKDIDGLHGLTMKEIILKYGADVVFDSIENDKNKYIYESEHYGLMKFLLKEGVINERYYDYMTIFYDNNYSVGDSEYIRAQYTEKQLPIDYKICNPEAVIKDLENVRFSRVQILNLDIFHYLLSENNYIEKLKLFIGTLKTNDNVEFLEKALNGKYNKKIYEIICEEWCEKLYKILDKWDEDNINGLIYYILVNSSEEKLIYLNSICELGMYISRHAQFINKWEENNNQKAIDALVSLSTKFEELNQVDSNFWMKHIVNYNLYKRGLDNLRIILKKVFSIEPKRSLFSAILKTNDKNFKEYIEKDIPQVLEQIINEGEEIEEREGLTFVLKHEELDPDLMRSFVKLNKYKVKRLYDVGAGYFDIILSERKIEYSAENIMHYYLFDGLTTELVSFINSSKKNSSYIKIIDEVKKWLEEWMTDYDSIESLYGKFCLEVMKNESINDDIAEKIMSNLKSYSKVCLNEPILLHRVMVLIKKGYLKWNKDYLPIMRKIYIPDVVILYLRKNLQSWINDLNSVVVGMTDEEFLDILDWDEGEFSVYQKVQLVNKYNPPTIELKESYDRLLKESIIGSHWLVNDKKIPYSEYGDYSATINNIVLVDAKKNIVNANHLIMMNGNLVSDLLKDGTIPVESRKLCFEKNIKKLSITQLIEALELFNYHPIASVFKGGKRQLIVNNAENNKMLSLLRQNRIIKSYSEHSC